MSKSQKRLETTDVNDKVHKSQLWSGNKRKRPRATNIRNNQPPCSFRQNNKNVDFFLLGREKQKSYWAPGGKRHTYMSLLKRYMGLYCLFMFFLLSPGTKSKHFLLYTRWFYWCYLCRCFFLKTYYSKYENEWNICFLTFLFLFFCFWLLAPKIYENLWEF